MSFLFYIEKRRQNYRRLFSMFYKGIEMYEIY